MKKKVLAGLVGTMLVSSVGFAAPVVDVIKGETVIGYNYHNYGAEYLGYDLGDFKANGFHIEHGLTDQILLGFETSKGEARVDLSATEYLTDKITNNDIYLAYKPQTDGTIQFILGSRTYKEDYYEHYWDGSSSSSSASENYPLYGLQGYFPLSDKVTGYAGFNVTQIEFEMKYGATYAITPQIRLDLNYTSKVFDDVLLDVKGIGFGLNYRF